MSAPLLPEDERRLVAGLIRRDERTFSELVRRFEGPVYAVALRMLNRRDEALDISQEVFVAIWRAGASFRAEARLSTWIHRIVINQCRNRLKHLSRRRDGSHDPLDEELSGGLGVPLSGEVPGPEANAQGNEAERFLRMALASLDPDHREVVILRELEGLEYDEIAAITGAKLGTVKSRLSRAREALESAYRAFVEGKRNSR